MAPKRLVLAIHRGLGGPHDSGTYNSSAWDTGFFVSDGGNWDSEYGRFFLAWYSGLLERHADAVLGAAAEALHGRGRPRGGGAAVKQVLRRLLRVSLLHFLYGSHLLLRRRFAQQQHFCCSCHMQPRICRDGCAWFQRPACSDVCLPNIACSAVQRGEEELVFEFQPACQLGVKLAGVHWWHKSRSHAAELTAGEHMSICLTSACA